MLPHPTHDRLIALGLVGMAKAFEEAKGPLAWRIRRSAAGAGLDG